MHHIGPIQCASSKSSISTVRLKGKSTVQRHCAPTFCTTSRPSWASQTRNPACQTGAISARRAWRKSTCLLAFGKADRPTHRMSRDELPLTVDARLITNCKVSICSLFQGWLFHALHSATSLPSGSIKKVRPSTVTLAVPRSNGLAYSYFKGMTSFAYSSTNPKRSSLRTRILFTSGS